MAQARRKKSLIQPGRQRVGDACWKAVRSRDRRADGRFVYAVCSTGIYCRPSCPSRKPRREQVLFFKLPETAEQKGFRPCRRCLPRTVRPPDPRVEAVARLCREIDRRIATAPGEGSEGAVSLAALSETAGWSPHQLDRAFRGVMGITARQYTDARRMLLLKSRLRRGDTVTNALYDTGYGSSSRLYERAPAHLGMTPAAYRQGGLQIQIRYTIAASPLGRLLVAATDRGVSAVYLGQSDRPLKAALEKEYLRAEIHRDRQGANDLTKWLKKVLAYLSGQEPNLDLPTDLRATAFQRRVWEELRRIPYGQTRTYSQIARSIGRPAAVRAVASACAKNPVSLVIPCHRVIREDGSLAGYRWGLDRKKALLEHESAAAKNRQGKRS